VIEHFILLKLILRTGMQILLVSFSVCCCLFVFN